MLKVLWFTVRDVFDEADIQRVQVSEGEHRAGVIRPRQVRLVKLEEVSRAWDETMSAVVTWNANGHGLPARDLQLVRVDAAALDRKHCLFFIHPSLEA